MLFLDYQAKASEVKDLKLEFLGEVIRVSIAIFFFLFFSFSFFFYYVLECKSCTLVYCGFLSYMKATEEKPDMSQILKLFIIPLFSPSHVKY